MTRRKSMFRIALVGSPNFPRYAVVDNRRPRTEPTHYWRGKQGDLWTTDSKIAMKWTDPEDLAKDMQQIVRYEMRDQPVRRFILTIDIELIGGQDVTQEQLQAYLDRALQLNIDYTGNGMGPVKDSAVLLSGDTSTLNEIDDKEAGTEL